MGCADSCLYEEVRKMDSYVMYDDHSGDRREIAQLNQRVDILSADLQNLLMVLNADKELEVSDHVRRGEFKCLMTMKDCSAVIDVVKKKLGLAISVASVIEQCPQYQSIPSANQSVVVRSHFFTGLQKLVADEQERARLHLKSLKDKLNFDTQSPQIYAQASYRVQDLGMLRNWLAENIFTATLDSIKDRLKDVRNA
jgi:hypothetical protein